jgi:hypothetical protein
MFEAALSISLWMVRVLNASFGVVVIEHVGAASGQTEQLSGPAGRARRAGPGALQGAGSRQLPWMMR